jgi:hypothetical protein
MQLHFYSPFYRPYRPVGRKSAPVWHKDRLSFAAAQPFLKHFVGHAYKHRRVGDHNQLDIVGQR